MTQLDDLYKALYGTNPPPSTRDLLADALVKAQPTPQSQFKLPIYTNPPSTALERKLQSYKDPASDSEQDRQARAERMVKAAIDGWHGFADTSVSFIVKGSYANNTNVKSDSDVDIAAIHGGMHYFNDSALRPEDKIVRRPITIKHYPDVQFRQQVELATAKHFGSIACDTTGKTAVTVAENGGRVSADIVPSFVHHTYYYMLTALFVVTKGQLHSVRTAARLSIIRNSSSLMVSRRITILATVTNSSSGF